MKKLLLFTALAFVGTFAYAQKPEEGDKTAEVNLNFQTGTSAINYTLPGELRFRYFTDANTAWRIRFGLNSSGSKYSVLSANNTDQADVTVKNGFSISIAPGYEKHWEGTDKLSPYYGAQLMFALSGSSTRDVTNSAFSTPTSATVVVGNSYSSKTGSTMGLGIGLFMGTDYYIADHLFIGGEFGLGLFSMSSTGDGEMSSTVGSTTTTTKTLKSSSSSLFGVGTGGVRLGFVF